MPYAGLYTSDENQILLNLSMHTVQLTLLLHNNAEHIGIFFPKNPALEMAIRKIKGIRWTQTHRCWYLPLVKANYDALVQQVKGIATVDAYSLKSFLQKRNVIAATMVHPVGDVCTPLAQTTAWGLHPHNLNALNRFMEQLRLKAYSPSTLRTYRNEFLQLLSLLKTRSVESLTSDDLRRYFVYCFEKLKIKENTLHSRTNALKFYFEQVLGREKFFWTIPRAKKPLLLPKLLNEPELERLFNSLANTKHKAMLFTAYSAGLRVSEVVNLKLCDIDSGRMQILVRQAKGKKDRYVNLSPVLLDILRSYLRTYRPKPELYLFESDYSQTAYPTRTVQQIFSSAKAKAGIHKEVGIHSLRHSFATHVLEKGTDIRYIKEILGHFNIKTTERYLHVARQQLVNVASPLDDLIRKGGIKL